MAYTPNYAVPLQRQRGLTFPSVKLGNFSVNIVLQATNCCGKGYDFTDWGHEEENEEGETISTLATLALVTDAGTWNTQKRLGAQGNMADTGLGLHRLRKFDGIGGPMTKAPLIVGWVFRDGRLKYFRNGVKILDTTAFSNAFTTFAHINSWLDRTTKSRGQIAEMKLYSQAWDDATMIHLQNLLDCKWHVKDNQDKVDCSTAKGNEKPCPEGIPLPEWPKDPNDEEDPPPEL